MLELGDVAAGVDQAGGLDAGQFVHPHQRAALQPAVGRDRPLDVGALVALLGVVADGQARRGGAGQDSAPA